MSVFSVFYVRLIEVLINIFTPQWWRLACTPLTSPLRRRFLCFSTGFDNQLKSALQEWIRSVNN